MRLHALSNHTPAPHVHVHVHVHVHPCASQPAAHLAKPPSLQPRVTNQASRPGQPSASQVGLPTLTLTPNPNPLTPTLTRWVYRILDCDTSGVKSAMCQKLVEIESGDEQKQTLLIGTPPVWKTSPVYGQRGPRG